MRSTARRVGVLLSSLVLASVGTIAVATSASAGSNQLITTKSGNVAWYHDGDKILACDADKDGMSIDANYRRGGDSGLGYTVNASGAGNCDSTTWNLEEGRPVEIRMCYRQGGVILECSAWQRGVA